VERELEAKPTPSLLNFGSNMFVQWLLDFFRCSMAPEGEPSPPAMFSPQPLNLGKPSAAVRVHEVLPSFL